MYCTVSRIFVEELSRNREGRAYENANGEKSVADEIDKEIKKLFVTKDILFHLHNFWDLLVLVQTIWLPLLRVVCVSDYFFTRLL